MCFKFQCDDFVEILIYLKYTHPLFTSVHSYCLDPMFGEYQTTATATGGEVSSTKHRLGLF